MKKSHYKLLFSLCIVTFLFLPKVHLGQSLTISELIKFRSMDNGDLNDILVAKGWVFVKNENDRNTWAFSKHSNKANAWLYKDKNWENKVYVDYVFCNTKDISILKSQLSALGFRKQNSEAHSSSITSEYTNTNYLITITYTASEDDYSCDSYSIHVEKRKSIQERQREEKEKEEARLAEIQNQKVCEINKVKREKRDSYFTSKVDSFNNSIDSILNITYQKQQPYRSGLESSDLKRYDEKRIQDSIEAAQRMGDSLAAMVTAMMPYAGNSWMPIPQPLKYGISMQSVLIYEFPSELSKAISGLYQNERIEILGEIGEYYVIVFDYCYENNLWNYSGYVHKSDLRLENQKQETKPKKK